MGFSDLCATVTVPKPEYERLIRTNERVEILKRYMGNHEYIDKKDLLALFDAKGRGEKNESLSD